MVGPGSSLCPSIGQPLIPPWSRQGQYRNFIPTEALDYIAATDAQLLNIEERVRISAGGENWEWTVPPRQNRCFNRCTITPRFVDELKSARHVAQADFPFETCTIYTVVHQKKYLRLFPASLASRNATLPPTLFPRGLLAYHLPMPITLLQAVPFAILCPPAHVSGPLQLHRQKRFVQDLRKPTPAEGVAPLSEELVPLQSLPAASD